MVTKSDYRTGQRLPDPYAGKRKPLPKNIRLTNLGKKAPRKTTVVKRAATGTKPPVKRNQRRMP